jgi:uncharacterized membrane protein
VIAVTQLAVIALQWVAGTRWIAVAGVLALMIIAATPGVWAAGLSAELPPALGAYVDRSLGSSFPFFPFAAFVLSGAVTGAAIGRQEPARRHRRAITWGLGLLALGVCLAWLLEGWVDFWRGGSPAYVLLRLGGLLLLLRGIEWLAERQLRGVPTLALLGHETLQVYVFHLYLLHGGIISAAPLGALRGQLGFPATFGVLIGMLPVLLAAAWAWHALKVRAPRESQLALAFLTVAFLWELVMRPW